MGNSSTPFVQRTLKVPITLVLFGVSSSNGEVIKHIREVASSTTALSFTVLLSTDSWHSYVILLNYIF